jgi:uncharacterized protein YndB with AHSA1/START domain
MTDPPVVHNIFAIERDYPAARARVFAAWRVVYVSTLYAGGRPATVSLTSIGFHATGAGTTLVLTEHGAF